MEKRRILRLGRKTLSMLLVFTMITSMLQLTAIAANDPDQTMEGYYIVDETGKAVYDESGATHVEEDGFKLWKTIDQTGLNQFEITLTVETSQTVTTSAAAIQLVIDNSSSMEQCADCGKNKGGKGGCNDDSHLHTRLQAIQDILTRKNGFLDSLASANTGAVYVSVVKFDKNAHKVTDWLNIKEADNLTTVKNQVTAITNGKGTNIHGGLLLGSNRLGMSEVANAGAKYMVLLSDGAPYAHADNSTDRYGRPNYDLTSTEYIPGTSNGDHETPAKNTAAEIRGDGVTLYTVGYGTTDDENELLENIAGSADRAFGGSDSVAVNAAFANIADSAVSGMSGAGTSVTDPMGGGGEYAMGQFIVLGDVSGLADDGVSTSGSTISWDLDPANASTETVGDTTVYTYTVTYPITLNTAAKGFEEFNEDGSVKYYPTNGYTYLSVPQADGSAKKIDFLVPGVCGTIPEVDWTVEYYLQEDAQVGDLANYTLDNTKTQGKVDLWSTVDAPAGYEAEYSNDNYQFESGNVKLEITPDGENVMKLYYKHITSTVLVNHFYKTDMILADGTEVPGEYPETAQKSSSSVEKISTEYVAVPEPIYDQGEYELVSSDPVSGEIIVSLDAESNVINLHYSRLVDERAITSAQVNHVYTTYGYELQDGEYVLVEQGVQNEVAEQANEIRATTVFDVNDQPLEGYGDFELNPELGDYAALLENDMSFVVADNAANNVRTLYFEKIVDERIPAEVVVNHYYTKSVTSVVDGNVVTTVVPDGELGSNIVISAYVGERVEASEANEYLGDLYESDAGNADKLVIEAVGAEGASIDLYYSLNVVPPKASLLVNHYWRTFNYVTVELTEDVVEEIATEVTEEVVDPVTGEVSTVTNTVIETVTKTVVVGTTTELRETLDHSVEEIEVNDLYEGQEYTAPKQEWGVDYYFNEEESNDTGIAGTDYVLNLYYDRYTDDDEREEAQIDVQHIYTTKLTTVVGGEVVVITQPDGTVTEEYNEYLAGDEFTAIAQPVYNENEYIQTTEESALGPVILQPGTNTTIVINYEREASDLVETKYAVNYEYRTYNMTIGEDGVAGYYEEPVVEYGDPVAGAGYVGQSISFGDGKREGFEALDGNPATTQILKAEGNEWTFVYEQYIPLEKGSVVVNHYYSQEIIAIDGTSTWTSSTVTEATVEKYLGESYTAQPVPNGYDKMDSILDGNAFPAPYGLTVTGDHVVDFHYKKVIDNSVRAPYSITHKYYLYDWDGTLLSGPADDLAPTITGVGYVTTTISAAPEASDYTLTGASYNGADLPELEGSAYTITLQEGSNDVVFVYEKTLARDLLDVTVIHNYYRDVAAMEAEVPEILSQYVETASDIPEASDYTAELRLEDGFEFHSAMPESMTVTVTEEGENVIILNYIRSAASYQVVHIYNTNGVEDGGTSELIDGKHGDVIIAGDIAKVPEYNGNTYTFTSVTEDITLDENEVKTITLVYNRVVMAPPSNPDPDPTYYELIVNWVDEDGNELDDTLEQSIREGRSYTTDQKSFEGYTFVESTGDAVSGRMNSDKTVTYIYAVDEVEEIEDIPDEEVPLGDLPDDEPLEDLFDEEVPLADVPETSDPVVIYSATAALSGMGLAVLGLTGKKRKEDEE